LTEGARLAEADGSGCETEAGSAVSVAIASAPVGGSTGADAAEKLGNGVD
jgi:hypothetical protein